MNGTPDSAQTPPDLGDGWAVAAPGEQGMDGALLAGIAKHFTAWAESNVHGVVIARRGALVYERYFTGEDQAWGKPLGEVTYDAAMRHDLRSMTKSITGLLVGIAFDRGWLDTIDTPVFSFFPEHDDLKTPEKAGITLAHLLTMSPGLAWDEDTPYSDPANSERQMSVAPDPVRYVLEQPLVRPPGISYNYGGGNTALLAAILKRVSGRDLDALAQDVLFDPLDITDVEWVRYPDGTPIAASGLRLRPRDIAKFGQLVLDKGQWHGERVVSADWITQSITPQINGQSLFFYGYHWWLGRSLVDKREVSWAAAVGWGGQRMFIVPSHGLVVTVLAGLYDSMFLQPIPGEVVLRRYALASVRP
ncbi:MAG: serine hydrolase [Pseudomonadota bacterium]